MSDTDKQLQAVCRNLREVEEKSVLLDEEKIAHIRERVRLTLGDISFSGTPDEIEILRERYRLLISDTETDGIYKSVGLPENFPYLKALYTADELLYKILFCLFVPETICDLKIPNALVKKAFEIPPRKRKCTIAYVKSPLCDEAYMDFCSAFENASAVYSDDFTEAAEDVYHSHADYTILPLSGEDGRLMSFYRLAEKYELHTVMATALTSNTDEGTTVYGLMSKSFELFSEKGGENLFFDFSISYVASDIPDVLYAARIMGLSLADIRCCNSQTDGDMSAVVTLCVGSSGRLDCFLTYLFLNHPRYTPLGLYTKF